MCFITVRFAISGYTKMNIESSKLCAASVPKSSKNWPVNWKIGPDGNPRPRRLYLAGPIRGIDDYARRFQYSADCVRSLGYKVFNPVKQDEFLDDAGVDGTIADYLELDLVFICRRADGVALLNGWRNSTGALAEYWTATATDKETWELPDELQLP